MDICRDDTIGFDTIFAEIMPRHGACILVLDHAVRSHKPVCPADSRQFEHGLRNNRTDIAEIEFEQGLRHRPAV